MNHMMRHRFSAVFLILLFLVPAVRGQEKALGTWDTQFDTQGLNDAGLAIAEGGGYIYVGGRFTMAGTTPANHIARWTGTGWTALGSGLNGDVSEIVCSGGKVYAGGVFTMAGGVPANNIAVWNGTSWSALGGGVNGQVYAIAVEGNYVYAGGTFTDAGGVAVNNIAVWDGTNWAALGSGVSHDDISVTPVVYDLLIGSDLYAGGAFEFTATGGTAKNVARWDGSIWHALDTGVPGHTNPANFETYVLSLASDWSNIYAGGAQEWTVDEYNDGTVYFLYWSYLYQWTGGQWNDVDRFGKGCHGGQPQIHKLFFDNGFMYIGGDFTDEIVKKGDEPWAITVTGYIAANNIVQFDGTNYHHLDTGVEGPVYDITANSSEVWAVGDFTSASGVTSRHVGRYTMGVLPDLTLIRVPFNFPTIQQAIDAATDGDTILVDPGVFNITQTIENDHVNHLLLMGSREEDGSHSTVISAAGSPGTYVGVRFSGVANCTMTGFEITGMNEAVAFDNCSDCLGKNNFMHDNKDGAGIWNSSNVEISNSIIDNNTEKGVEIWQSSHILIDHNTILRSQTGAGIDISSASDIISVKNNILAWSGGAGIETNSLSFTSFIHDYDCYYSNPGGDIAGHSIGSHSLLGDPMLVDINSQNYYLQTGSPCISSGESGGHIGALGEFVTGIREEGVSRIRTFELGKNFPNPFNPETCIPYDLPEPADVNLSVYNLRGERLVTLVNTCQPAGQYRVVWDGRDAGGRPAVSGIYIYRLKAGSRILSGKMCYIQ